MDLLEVLKKKSLLCTKIGNSCRLDYDEVKKRNILLIAKVKRLPFLNSQFSYGLPT